MKNGINNSSKNYDSNCGPYDMYGRTLVVNHINYDGFIRLCALQVLLEELQHIHTHNSSVVQNKAYCKSMYSIPKTVYDQYFEKCFEKTVFLFKDSMDTVLEKSMYHVNECIL